MDYENWKPIIREGNSMISSEEVVVNDLSPSVGGNIVCSFIHREKDAYILGSSYQMLEALENLENDNDQIEITAWDMVQAAIKSARGK